MAGSSTAEAGTPAFYFDLGSPGAYLAAERVLQIMPVATEWIPVLGRGLPATADGDTFRCVERDIAALEIERTAAARGLQPVRWPDPFPFDSLTVMRAATYAKSIGRVVAFSLAAFRQAFAGGWALDDPDSVLIAAAACEMHPAAVLRALGLRGVADSLTRATALAGDRGVRAVPAVWTGAEVFHGEAALEDAARALAPA